MVNNFGDMRIVILLLAGSFFGSSVGAPTTVAAELTEASASDVYSTTTEDASTAGAIEISEKMTESNVKSSTDENEAKSEEEPLLPEFPVDLLSDVVLFDPNVVLARATRDMEYLVAVNPLSLDDDIPTIYFGKEIDDFRFPEQQEKGSRRFARDLDTAADGFIVRPLFKYRHEQYKRRNRQGYKNRDVYSIYNQRNPLFSGK